MEVFVARQPIFDNDYNIVAYELLYRDSLRNYYDGDRADNVATSLLIANAFFSFGIENLVGDKKAFINFDQYSILQGIPELLDANKVVIEILETVEPDKKFLNKIDSLTEAGYTIALDDYDTGYEFDEVISRVKLIKVDFFLNTHSEIEKIVKVFRNQKKILLAEKVETKEEFEWAKSLGFDLYQGYYFEKPAIQKSKKLDNNAIQYIKLMSELHSSEPNIKNIAEILKLDIALTFKLLTLVNEIVKPLEKIGSIQQAIVMLGVNRFRRWLTLSVVQNMAKRETLEMTKSALFRSYFLGLIAQNSNLNNYQDELTLLGTLSVLDTILEISIEEVINRLPLEYDIAGTLLGHKTKYSKAYDICLNYEKGHFDRIEIMANSIDYSIVELQKNYIESIKWSEEKFTYLNKFI